MALHWPFIPIVLPTAALGLLLSLPLALACCNDVVPPSVEPPERATYSPSCSVAFSPIEALRLDAEAAADRWSAATGCAIDVGDAGVPMLIVAAIRRPDGTQAPGWTSDERDRVEVNVRCGATQRASTVLHEMGHALGGDHVDSHGILSGEKGRVDIIDAAALESVCSRLDCPLLSPEAP